MEEKILSNMLYGWQSDGRFLWLGKECDPITFSEKYNNNEYSDLKIFYADMRNLNLKHMNFQNITFKGTSFENSDMQYINLDGCNLDRCNFNKVHLSDATLKNCSLYEAKMSHAIAKHVHFNNSLIQFAILEHSDFGYSIFINTNLEYSTLRHSKLYYCNLRDANLKSTNVSHVIFRGANFKNTNMDLSQINLTCSDFDIHIDDKLAIQQLFHLLKKVEYSKHVSDEIKDLLMTPQIIMLANRFHKANECGTLPTLKTREGHDYEHEDDNDNTLIHESKLPFFGQQRKYRDIGSMQAIVDYVEMALK